ncbi:MAG: 2OG-Fe(II) oxygenase family protein [Pseudomonadota bacterium]|nr:2OG-Fe(II) oxygenase family protein [Pseudomonadota bacterium]
MGIINTLNIEELKQQYRETGYVVIKNLLRDEVAQAAYEALKTRVPGDFHYREMNTGRVGVVNPADLERLTPREIKRLVPTMATLRDNDFSFAYCRYTIPSGAADCPEPVRILSDIFHYFNSDEYLGLLADITGDASGKEVSTWCSRYDRNHHLSVHMDESQSQTRIAAHVLALSKDWKQEWGGNFAFCNAEGEPDIIVPPSFNSLMLFKVPRLHLVTQVESFVGESRYSLFGWYKVEKEYFHT